MLRKKHRRIHTRTEEEEDVFVTASDFLNHFLKS